jgi:hypothetical protein
MKNFAKKHLQSFLVLAVFLLSQSAFAFHNGKKAKASSGKDGLAAGCAAPRSSIEMSFNNVYTLYHTGGDKWITLATSLPAYRIPKEGRAHSLFAGALWLGGLDVNGQLKLAAQTFRDRGNDYWPGPLSTINATTDAATCAEYDKFWGVSRQQVNQFVAWFSANLDDPAQAAIDFPGYQIPNEILTFPAHGDLSRNHDYYLAPFFDRNGDGDYNPFDGDYPYYDLTGEIDCRLVRDVRLFGDTTIWYVFNDNGNIHTQTQGDPIGMEVRAQAFAFATNDFINNFTFNNYELVNRSTFTLTNTYFAVWADPDLGFYDDDFVGCDVNRGLGYCYNGLEVDGFGQPDHYGANPPAVGIDFFEGPFQDFDGIDNQVGIGANEALNGLGYGDAIIDNERFGMRRFIYYNKGNNPINGEPNVAQEYYNYMRGIWRNGERMTYGGNGTVAGGGNPTVFADFMFPNTTDPQGWGTNGNPQPAWSEESSGNLPFDRRFLQSAGPFTLEPGDRNDITVGVVWARASQGGPYASVARLKEVDDVAQNLFDNCFRLLDGPDAPLLSFVELDQELILMLDNPAFSNNASLDYEEEDFRIPTNAVNVEVRYILDTLTGQYDQVIVNDTVQYDRSYRFQGYLVYQLKDLSVSPDELGNPDRARLVAQCDIKDSISKIINYTFDENLQSNIPDPVVIDGKNDGISHSFSIKEDLFATGNRTLVNHKTYYYLAVAYAYNQYKRFDQFDPNFLDGQTKPYLLSRRTPIGGLVPLAGIPHKEHPRGLVRNSDYGDTPRITRVEGQGNGGNVLDISSESEATILAGFPWKVDNLTYRNNRGPITVKVIDPLNVPADKFLVEILPSGTPNDADLSVSKWKITNLTSGEEVVSDAAINLKAEQIFPEWGISVLISQVARPGNSTLNNNGVLPSSIVYNDPTKRWLGGVSDADGGTPYNWIRSGTSDDPDAPQFDEIAGRDDGKYFQGIIEGTWAPYGLVAFDNANGFPSAPATNLLSRNLANPNLVKSVDVVITNDKSKWTRCPVIEAQNNPILAQGNVQKNRLRKAPSVDKNGNPDGSGTEGMGWFPGYAINIETGERLNMAFAEDSNLPGENGRDMKWNPTSTEILFPSGEVRFGGKHFIYVFNNERSAGIESQGMPGYDEGQFLYTQLLTNTQNAIRLAWKACMWVGFPLVNEGQTLMSTDARVRLRVARPYELYETASNINAKRPLYEFGLEEFATGKNDLPTKEDALAMITAVPNPYYAYSEYEVNQLDNRIKIINLPEVCDVTIYSVNGTLIRSFKKADPRTSIDWDLENNAGIKIAGGVYLIHVKVEGVGEKVVKWFGVTRPLNLDGF